MADQGAILVNTIAIKLKGLTEEVYTLDGFLHSFKVIATKVKYIHLVENDVIKSNLQMFQQNIPKGYYSEDNFLEYRKTKDISKLGKEYEPFISAEIGDIIQVKKIKLSSPFNSIDFGYTDNYTLIYNGHSLVNDFGEIIKSVPFNPVTESMNLNSVAKIFYEKNIHHNSTAITNEEKYDRALTIAKTSIYIHNINAVLFPLFTESKLIELKNEQNNYWQNDVFKTNPLLSDIKEYFNSVYNFFRGAYLNQKKIEDAKGYEKVYWLAQCLSVNTLKILTAGNKIALLSWMQANVRIGQQWLFLNDNEGLVLKIIDSVTVSQADLFLELLFQYSTTTYDNLFDRLADEKGFLQSNAIDDSTFSLGENNRYKFIMALYLIWQASSYNPYQNDTFSQSNLEKYNYNHLLGTNPDPSNSFFNTLISDPTKVNFEAQPISLNYNSTSSAGYYIDNFYFRSTNIAGNLNHANLENLGSDLKDFTNLGEAPKNKILAFQKEYRVNSKDGLYGTYDYLQPVSLINANASAAVKIAVVNGENSSNTDANNLIPIFVLKYIDDKNLESNVETTVGYLIDIASLYFGGTALVSKFRYIRSVSGFSEAIIGGSEHGIGTVVKLYVAFGTEAINFTAASLSLYCKIITDSNNHDKPWLINMKETLMWIEIFSGVGSMVAENMLRKKTKALVEDFNANNNWPTEFTTDPRGLEAQLTLQKISGVDVAFDLINFTSDALIRLERKFDLDIINFEKNIYSLAQKQQIIAKGFAKGLSTDEISGIIHQACRRRTPTMPISISEFEIRMERYLLVKRRRWPFTFETKEEFDSYVSTYIETTLDKFGLPNKNKYYGGSSITSNTSFSGGVQDTDWTVYWDKKEDIIEFINKQKDLYRQKAIIENINKPGKYANARANSMLSFFEKNGYIPKNSIISIDENGIVYRLQDYLDDFPEFLKTDITPKLKDYNNTSPSILY